MKIYLNRKFRNQAWGGGNQFFKNWYLRCEQLATAGGWNHEICNPQDPQVRPDTILICGIDPDNDDGISFQQAYMYKKLYNSNAKIILRVNDNDARKGTSNVDRTLVNLSSMIDGTVFVSNWLKDYFVQRGWKCDRNVVIVNGIDREIFKARKSQDSISEKIRIISHHWSDNRLKGQDVTEWIDNDFLKRHGDKFSFTFVGRTQANLKRSKLIQPLHGQKLGEELANHDVYISGSRHDPGPNHCIEAIATGLPTYVHVDGGGCVEFAGDDHVFSSFEQLESILLGSYKKNNDSFVSWEHCIDEYLRFIETT